MHPCVPGLKNMQLFIRKMGAFNHDPIETGQLPDRYMVAIEEGDTRQIVCCCVADHQCNYHCPYRSERAGDACFYSVHYNLPILTRPVTGRFNGCRALAAGGIYASSKIATRTEIFNFSVSWEKWRVWRERFLKHMASGHDHQRRSRLGIGGTSDTTD